MAQSDLHQEETMSLNRELMLSLRWQIGCQELRSGGSRKSLIRQIWIPSEWLNAADDKAPYDDVEPDSAAADSSASKIDEPASDAALTAAAPMVKAEGGSGTSSTTDSSKMSSSSEGSDMQDVMPGFSSTPPSKAVSSAKAQASQQASKKNAAFVGEHHSKESRGSTHAATVRAVMPRSILSTVTSNASNGSVPVNTRSIINIDSCIAPDKGMNTTRLNGEVEVPAAQKPVSANEQATAAISAMLGLGKASSLPPAPAAPPPRTPAWAMSGGGSYGHSGGLNAQAAPFAPAHLQRHPGLNPNAAEFRPLLSTKGVAPQAYSLAPASMPPPRQPPAVPPHFTAAEDGDIDFSCEVTNLLGEQLFDEICGGGVPMPSSARTSVGTSRETEETDEEAWRAERLAARSPLAVR
eukprot:TRINITY_DN76523_c0_g1_i1.p1 TRINITY_DN76523_c0_g1~~TRINITY_DN76523_c0_g1_i1.p1  ORF type:complete len:409 (+),score=98.47 TRINITY_DN76523_c0_g1_i1:112-1338(+)